MKLGDSTISVFISDLGRYRVTINYASIAGGTVVWRTWSEMFELPEHKGSPEEDLVELLQMVVEKLPR